MMASEDENRTLAEILLARANRTSESSEREALIGLAADLHSQVAGRDRREPVRRPRRTYGPERPVRDDA